ncbi:MULTISPECIES: VanW family protein [Bacillaceae]|uniref:VanW family protein n=1 Tax=Bacillaceae TaxID=186817 RepID=UPI0004E187C8|nr:MULTISPECIES: VanW family protein [Bacillaceae]MCM3360704.1 VanW family protein [Niallia sp. MER TA 168]
MDKKTFTLFIRLFIATFFLFGGTSLGVYAFQKADKEELYPINTSVAGISIGGLTELEAKNMLENHLIGWKANAIYEFQYKEKTVQISNDIFVFDVEETLKNITENSANDFVVNVREEVLQTELEQYNSFSMEDIDIDLFKSALLEAASILQVDKKIAVEEYFASYVSGKDLLNTVEMTVPDQIEELESVIPTIKEITILPKTTFSLLGLLEDVNQKGAKDETVSILATGIYQLVLQTNFDIRERTISKELPDYVDVGYEAKASFRSQLDLRFTNPNEHAYLIALKVEENQLILQLKGQEFPNRYEIVIEEKEEYEPKTIVQFDSLLEGDQVKVKQEGKNGISVGVIKEVLDKNGDQVKRESIATDYYPPIYRVEVRGLPNNKDIEQTDSMEDGEEAPIEEDLNDPAIEESTMDEENNPNQEIDQEKEDDDLNDSIDDDQIIEK